MLALVQLSICQSAQELATHSFSAPFISGPSAARSKDQLEEHWKVFGTAAVHNNFVRLTSEKQSQRGGLWSTSALAVPAFYTILEFRMSGTAKTMFGDGLGLWVARHGHFSHTGQHGCTEEFYGVDGHSSQVERLFDAGHGSQDETSLVLMDINIESHEECASESGCKEDEEKKESNRDISKEKMLRNCFKPDKDKHEIKYYKYQQTHLKNVLERMQGRLATFNLSRML
jgi:hypothetical protein